MRVCYDTVMTEQNIKRFQLRLPPKVHDDLRAVAQRDSRSLHSEALLLLRRCLEQELKRGSEPS